MSSTTGILFLSLSLFFSYMPGKGSICTPKLAFFASLAFFLCSVFPFLFCYSLQPLTSGFFNMIITTTKPPLYIYNTSLYTPYHHTTLQRQSITSISPNRCLIIILSLVAAGNDQTYDSWLLRKRLRAPLLARE